MHIITQTPRLIVREFLPEELETYLAHFNDERVTQYIPKRTRDERVNIFNKALANYQLTKKLGIWGIFNADNGEFIGSCLLRAFNEEPGVIELGYSMDHKYWGKGIGSEMGLAMVQYGFLDADIDEIVAVTELENIGSQRVLEKAGLKRMDNIFREDLELAFFKMGKA